MIACTASRRGIGETALAGARTARRAAGCVLVLSAAAAAGRRAAAPTWQTAAAGPCRPLAPCYRRRDAHRPLAVPRCESPHPSAVPETAPSGRSIDASTPLALSYSSGGLSMAKNAANLICPPLKSFPVNGLQAQSARNEGGSRKSMILRSYTLCEVTRLADL